MKRILIILALLAPALGLLYFTLQPQADLTVNLPIFHFYLVTFITFAAAVISILLAATLGMAGRPRHVLAAAAFAVIGSIFFSHGLATPGALMEHTHPAVSWSAWLTLFGGGALFAAAALDGPDGAPGWMPVRRIVYAAVIGVLFYSAIAAFAPDILTYIDDHVAPWHRDTIFVLTLLLWAFAAWRLWQTWRVTRSRVDGALAFVAFWLGTATVSMHRFPVWNLSWWLYHAILLIAFLATAIMLAIEYEQVRQFRLSRYFLAVALIVTAFLALAASALFTQFSYDTLVTEVQNVAGNTAANLASGLASDLPNVTTPDALHGLSDKIDVDRLLQSRMQNLPIKNIYLYSTNLKLQYPGGYDSDTPVSVDRTNFFGALDGNVVVMVHTPDSAPSGYAPASGVHVVETYAPLRAGGKPNGVIVGVLVTIQEAPSLDKAIISARITGLLIGALTMGLLFLALLSVVIRADRIISVRTEDLRRVSAQLKTYSEWLLGADLLGRVLSDPDALSLARRERTVVFIDIRNFTGWSEQRTPEEVVAMLNRYYTAAETIAKQHNVIKLKFAADEVMAIFPDAQRAATTALALRTELNRMLGEYDLGAGIGLNTGRLVEGLLGSKDVKFYDVIGDTVNTAKRIENAASSTETLISETTRLALGDAASVGPARQIEAKGKEAPVTVYPLLAK
ncbi:MAG: adenylate/guanylate cyclase domain-containing protein [Anaerolineales bacterium]